MDITINGFNDYHEKALRTLKPAKDKEELLLHSAMGLAGEAAELLAVRRDSEKSIIELGDVLWYIPVMGEYLDMSMDDLYLKAPTVSVHSSAWVDLIVINSGAILDMVKKHIFYGKPIDKSNLINYLGAIIQSASAVSMYNHVDIIEVMRRNIAKLAARYPDKFEANLAIHKNEEAEIATIVT